MTGEMSLIQLAEELVAKKEFLNEQIDALTKEVKESAIDSDEACRGALVAIDEFKKLLLSLPRQNFEHERAGLAWLISYLDRRVAAYQGRSPSHRVELHLDGDSVLGLGKVRS